MRMSKNQQSRRRGTATNHLWGILEIAVHHMCVGGGCTLPTMEWKIREGSLWWVGCSSLLNPEKDWWRSSNGQEHWASICIVWILLCKHEVGLYFKCVYCLFNPLPNCQNYCTSLGCFVTLIELLLFGTPTDVQVLSAASPAYVPWEFDATAVWRLL